ncbi:hypothetical protein LNP02_14280 [Klebsiella variicola subsp. variicola]|nr:hypothetical protein [Klebsiella variicola subsp. variicola]
MALEAAWREGEEAMARLQRCRPSLDLRKPRRLAAAALFDDLCALYRTRFDPDGLQVDMASPHLIGFGQRTPLLACLSLWLDRTWPSPPNCPPCRWRCSSTPRRTTAGCRCT